MVDLAEVADKRLGELSGGLQRRVDLAAALVHLPGMIGVPLTVRNHRSVYR